MAARGYFITGGTGLIGRALVRALLRQDDGARYTLLTRDAKRFAAAAPDIANAPGVSLLEGDLASAVLPRETPGDVILGAASVNTGAGLAASVAAAELAGTLRLLDWSKDAQRVLYMSSGAVYAAGGAQPGGIPESAPTHDAATPPPYTVIKRRAEQACLDLAARGRIAVRIARIFSVIGPETPLDAPFALANFVRDALDPSCSAIRVAGDGTASRSYLHVDDLAAWLIEMHEAAPRVFTANVGSSREVSMRELAQLIADRSGKTVSVAGGAAGARTRYVPDIRLIRETLDVRETRTLESALDELLAAARAAR